jgi:predicted transcriptional regulator
MTENQKAVLNLLKDKEMTLEDIAVELHSCNKRMKKILLNMEKSKWIEKDEDTDVYTILIDYAPTIEWSFKELLGAWKI